jgi:hypothetical protein
MAQQDCRTTEKANRKSTPGGTLTSMLKVSASDSGFALAGGVTVQCGRLLGDTVAMAAVLSRRRTLSVPQKSASAQASATARGGRALLELT